MLFTFIRFCFSRRGLALFLTFFAISVAVNSFAPVEPVEAKNPIVCGDIRTHTGSSISGTGTNNVIYLDRNSDGNIDAGDKYYKSCTGVTVVTEYAEPVWARTGEALIFIAPLIIGVAVFWWLVGKVLRILRLRRA